MNILGIGSSARREGNSNSLLRLAVEGACERGATADVLYARDLKIQGCLACDGCKRSAGATCVVKDDMHDVYARIRACDILVLATPVYFYSMSSWLKAIVDRCYGLLDPDGKPRIDGDKGFYVITTEEEERTFAGQEIVGTLMRGLAWFKMDLRGELVAVELSGPHDWEKREDLAAAAKALISVE